MPEQISIRLVIEGEIPLHLAEAIGLPEIGKTTDLDPRGYLAESVAERATLTKVTIARRRP